MHQCDGLRPDRILACNGTVAEAWVNDIMLHFGAPEVMVSDNGPEYTNKLMAAINHLLRTRHVFTVPYNPSANGSVEKRNQTLIDMLSHFCQSHQDDWDLFLPVIVHAYNTTINISTGYTPFRAVFGYEAKTPSESWVEEFATTYNVDIDDYATRLTDCLSHIWSDIAKRTFYHQQHLSSRKPDPRARVFTPFRVGEQFYLRTIPRRTFKDALDEKWHKLSAKLQYRYSGPHTVLAVINPVTYRARVDGSIKIIHANRMKRDPRKRTPSISQDTSHDAHTQTITDPLLLTRTQVDQLSVHSCLLAYTQYHPTSQPRPSTTSTDPPFQLPHNPHSNTCTVCQTIFPTRNKLYQHIRMNTPSTLTTIHQCEHCQYNTPNRNNIIKHAQRKHKNSQPPIIHCPQCQWSFYNIRHYKRHVHTKHNTINPQCHHINPTYW